MGDINAKSVREWKMVPGENRLLVIGRKMFYYRCIVEFCDGRK